MCLTDWKSLLNIFYHSGQHRIVEHLPDIMALQIHNP